jgi:anti-anti-sigma factor
MTDTTLPFSCAVVPHRQAVHVCPSGELDVNTVAEVEARLAELHLAGFDEIVLDLSGLAFFDSSGVHLVMRWTRRAAAERFRFTVVAGTYVVDSVLRMTGAEAHVAFARPPFG